MATRYSRRHYQDIARIFNEQCPDRDWGIEYSTWYRLRVGFMRMLKADNIAFNSSKFLDATEEKQKWETEE